MESIRALIDRDVVRPIEGVYRIVGDVGQLEVPDSLHALLAARLDALDPQVRQVLTGAAVLGSSFPAEAVAGVSGLPSTTVESILSELLRREVFQVSADPRSPERGNYRFSQEMLRQVAYETLSRRDRKARHLAVAAHLRATFPRDGEEVIDVVARHYVDALDAVPDDSDIAEIRELAIAALVEGGRPCLAGRLARPGRASFLDAADLVERADKPMIREPPTCCCAVPRRCDSARPPWSPCRSPNAPSRPTSGSATIGPWRGHAPCSAAPCAASAGTPMRGCS